MATKYTILPTARDRFAGLDLMTRAVFGLIWDRWLLSMKTFESRRGKFSTTKEVAVEQITPRRRGDKTLVKVAAIYCVITQAELTKETGLCERTVRKCIRTLEDAKLIQTERAGIRGANRYYCDHLLCDYFTARCDKLP